MAFSGNYLLPFIHMKYVVHFPYFYFQSCLCFIIKMFLRNSLIVGLIIEKTIFIGRERESERETLICCSTYLCVQWLILIYALTGDQTCNLDLWEWHSNHSQSNLARTLGHIIFNQSNNCLLISMFSSFTFNIIIGMVVAFKSPMLMFILYLLCSFFYCSSFSVFS